MNTLLDTQKIEDHSLFPTYQARRKVKSVFGVIVTFPTEFVQTCLYRSHITGYMKRKVCSLQNIWLFSKHSQSVVAINSSLLLSDNRIHGLKQDLKHQINIYVSFTNCKKSILMRSCRYIAKYFWNLLYANDTVTAFTYRCSFNLSFLICNVLEHYRFFSRLFQIRTIYNSDWGINRIHAFFTTITHKKIYHTFYNALT